MRIQCNIRQERYYKGKERKAVIHRQGTILGRMLRKDIPDMSEQRSE